MAWVEAAVAELKSLPGVQLLPRSTVFGYYDHNFLGIIERVTEHLLPGSSALPPQRLWRVRARQVVIAAGSFERPLVFHNNDRPGVMLASAVSAYVNRYAVAPGSRAVVFTNNDSAYSAVLDMIDAGISIAAVVDVRTNLKGDLPLRVRQKGVELTEGHAVLNAEGSRTLEAVEIACLDTTGEGLKPGSRRIRCDLLATSGGWNPTLDMHCQSGAKAVFEPLKACFVPGPAVQAERSAGACKGTFDLVGCLREGVAAGAAAAQALGLGGTQEVVTLPEVERRAEEPLHPLWVVPSRFTLGRGPKQFVDYQNDTSVGDIVMAARENFESIEHIKRYTLLGFGTDQGKIGNVNGIGVLAKFLGKDIASVGTTTFRPAYSPVTFGALAGRNVGALFDPIRKTPMHQWHAQAGAQFENVGQWKRAWYYPKAGETMDEAVKREVWTRRKA